MHTSSVEEKNGMGALRRGDLIMPRLGLVLVALTRRPKEGLAFALVATMALTTGMAAAQSFTEYPIPTAGSGPMGITAGPDGTSGSATATRSAR
jgi:hypothetical protein